VHGSGGAGPPAPTPLAYAAHGGPAAAARVRTPAPPQVSPDGYAGRAGGDRQVRSAAPRHSAATGPASPLPGRVVCREQCADLPVGERRAGTRPAHGPPLPRPPARLLLPHRSDEAPRR